MEILITILKKVRELPAPGPILIHVVTKKRKSYPPAKQAFDKMHGEIVNETVHLIQLTYI